MKTPFFTISLDFELLWGIFPVESSASYGANILGGRQAIPLILSLFKQYNIHATWGVVAMASFKNKREMRKYFPEIKPAYRNSSVDPYKYLDNVGENESDDPLHFGYSLVRQITDVDGMEIGSHTFSHFYCLEEYSKGAFKADLQASNESFKRLNIETNSLIFSRNQYDSRHLKTAKDMGFTTYRGNEGHYLYRPRQKHALPIRAVRLADSYINISGDHLSKPHKEIKGLINIPSSRFLRPASTRNYFENLRLNRIKTAMLSAATSGQGFHLWWHPHNFGGNLSRNMNFLSEILLFYRYLNEEYGMESLSMCEVAQRVNSLK